MVVALRGSRSATGTRASCALAGRARSWHVLRIARSPFQGVPSCTYALAAVLASFALAGAAFAQAPQKLVFLTNWFAQAEHGGFYQAVAEGIYRKHGLDVTVRMGGPQVNGMQLLLAGQADLFMGYDIQVLLGRQSRACRW